MTRNSASADSSPRVGLPGRYQHNPVPRRHASKGPPGPMPRRHVASDGLTENFRDSPTQHRARHSRGRQPRPVFRARRSGLVMSIDEWRSRWDSAQAFFSRCTTSRRVAFQSTYSIRPPVAGLPHQLRGCPSRLRDPQSPSLPKRTIAASLARPQRDRRFGRARIQARAAPARAPESRNGTGDTPISGRTNWVRPHPAISLAEPASI